MVLVVVQVLLTSSNSYSQGRREGSLGDYLEEHRHLLLLQQQDEPVSGRPPQQQSSSNETWYLFGNHHGQ